MFVSLDHLEQQDSPWARAVHGCAYEIAASLAGIGLALYRMHQPSILQYWRFSSMKGLCVGPGVNQGGGESSASGRAVEEVLSSSDEDDEDLRRALAESIRESNTPHNIPHNTPYDAVHREAATTSGLGQSSSGAGNSTHVWVEGNWCVQDLVDQVYSSSISGTEETTLVNFLSGRSDALQADAICSSILFCDMFDAW